MSTFPLVIVVFVMLLAQLAWSQNSASGLREEETSTQGKPSSRATRLARSGSTPTDSGTQILFRETFDFSIYTEGIPQFTTLSCSAIISTYDSITNYEEGNTATATVNGTSTTCIVPILATWTLANPGTDMIAAAFKVSAGGRYTIPAPISLPIPSNGQTVTSNFSITLGQ